MMIKWMQSESLTKPGDLNKQQSSKSNGTAGIIEEAKTFLADGLVNTQYVIVVGKKF
jgi:hypothetical protein